MPDFLPLFVRGDIVFLIIIAVLAVGFFVSLLVIRSYGKNFVRKDEELTSANLDLKSRNKELNEVTKILLGRDLELSRSNEKLMELDELKSKFVSTAAHQLRTPLTTIKWSLHEILEGDFGKLKKDQEKAIQDIITAANRLISLVNDLLDVSRLEEGREIFEMKKQDLVSALKDIYNRFKKAADTKGIKLVFEPQLLALDVVFDEEKLLIAIANLVDNAIKYTMPGGQVAIKITQKDKQVQIDVSDTGIGVPKDEANHIFNRFFRAHNAMMLETYGSGLGLSVVKEVVEKHNGSITFESEEGKGSTFSITLPMIL